MKEQKVKKKSNVYLRCDACDELHPSDEMEIVTVRIHKGKACELKRGDMFDKAPKAPTHLLVHKDMVRDTETLTDVAPAKDLIPAALAKKVVQHKHYANMMIPPGDERFESQGAKETRRT